MKNAIVIFSGGPDSTAAAYWAINEGYEVELLTFRFADNGSQNGELHSAKEVSKELDLQHNFIDFTSPLHQFSSQSRVPSPPPTLPPRNRERTPRRARGLARGLRSPPGSDPRGTVAELRADRKPAPPALAAGCR